MPCPALMKGRKVKRNTVQVHLLGDAAARRERRRAQGKAEQRAGEEAARVAAEGAVRRELVGVLAPRRAGHKVDALPRVGRADARQVLAVRVEEHQLRACASHAT